MSAFKIAQKVSAITTGAGATGITTIALQTGYIRIHPEADIYVEVGDSPTISTTTSLYVSNNSPVTLKESARSQKIVGIATGSTTTITFPEGTGCPFNTGDYVAVTGITPSTLTNSYVEVASINTRAGVGGDYSTKAVLTWDTSSATVSGASTAVFSNAESRRAIQVLVQDDASGGKTHIVEVQMVGAS